MSWKSDDTTLPTWREELFQDAARIWQVPRPPLRHMAGAFLTEPGLAAAMLYRLGARLSRLDHPFLVALAGRLNLALHGCQVHPSAVIGPGMRLPHPAGIVVGRGVQAGRDLTLFQNVTLGALSWEGGDYPVLEDGVVVFANSLVLGAVRVGANARVGAGSIVLHDVAPGDTVAGIPAVSLKGHALKQ
jgi:serine O-acetyltransferase